MARWTKALTRAEWIRLSGFGSAVLFLHLLGWGLFVYYARHNPALAGLGSLAYTFGLRHAFDADHIAAIDNTTRKFLQDGKRSMGVGFFFSLGHSTIVFSLATGLAIAAKTVNSKIPGFQNVGGYIGASVSGTFLLLIGLLNLVVLLDVLGVFRQIKQAGVATHHVPFLAVISLPLIFAAGMSLMDTADGAFMSHAYGWAFSNPVRKVYYNITVTSLSVAVALLIGMIELLQVTATKFSLTGGFWAYLDNLNFGNIGYVVVGLFVVTWAFSVVLWKTRRIEARWSGMIEGG